MYALHVQSPTFATSRLFIARFQNSKRFNNRKNSKVIKLTKISYICTCSIMILVFELFKPDHFNFKNVLHFEVLGHNCTVNFVFIDIITIIVDSSVVQ